MDTWGNATNKANYFFLMDVGDGRVSAEIDANLVRMTLTGCGLSLVGNMLSLLLICFLPLKSDGLFVVGNLCFGLLLAQLSFIAAENSYQIKAMCKLSTAVLHYFFLTIHFWSFAYSVHLIIKAKRWKMAKKIKPRTIYLLIGWLAPVAVVAITAVMRGDTFGNDEICWLSQEKMTRWAFVGPVIVIMALNTIVMLTMMILRLILDVSKDVPVGKKILHQVVTAVSLIPVLSLTWVFGVPSAALSHGMIYIFVFLNSSQGLWVFLGQLLGSEKIRSMVFKRPLEQGGVMKTQASDGNDTDNTEVSQVAIVAADTLNNRKG